MLNSGKFLFNYPSDKISSIKLGSLKNKHTAYDAILKLKRRTITATDTRFLHFKAELSIEYLLIYTSNCIFLF